MGPMRLRVSVDNIERTSKRKAAAADERERPSITRPLPEDRPEVSTQLDMRGWRVEDALEELETYLNDAVLSGMSSVRKGTGALRASVRQQLAHHPLVKSFVSASLQEGGDVPKARFPLGPLGKKVDNARELMLLCESKEGLIPRSLLRKGVRGLPRGSYH